MPSNVLKWTTTIGRLINGNINNWWGGRMSTQWIIISILNTKTYDVLRAFGNNTFQNTPSFTKKHLYVYYYIHTNPLLLLFDPPTYPPSKDKTFSNAELLNDCAIWTIPLSNIGDWIGLRSLEKGFIVWRTYNSWNWAWTQKRGAQNKWVECQVGLAMEREATQNTNSHRQSSSQHSIYIQIITTHKHIFQIRLPTTTIR